jgi:phage baseplate assembly protein W
MPTYVGFSTIDANQPREFLRSGVDGGVGSLTQTPRLGKKFKMVDVPLVVRDLTNAFSIRQGEKVGNPTYGTTMWNYVFEPNTNETRVAIETEIRRVASQDPRVQIDTLQVFELDNGILVELEVFVSMFENAVQVGLLFDRTTGQISGTVL